MCKFPTKFLLLAASIIAPATYAADSGFLFGVEVNRGGNLVFPDQSAPSSSDYSVGTGWQSHSAGIREGDNITAKVGYQLELGNYLALRAAVGYAWSQDNRYEIKTSHMPIEGMIFLKNGQHYFGAGPVVHYNRTVDSKFDWTYKTTDSNGDDVEIDYHTPTRSTDKFAAGFKLEYNYQAENGFYLGGQYTYMRYKYDQKGYIWQATASNGDQIGAMESLGTKPNASSAGVTIGYRF